MKPLFVLITACVLLSGSAAHAGDPAVEKPIHQMMAGFNNGDIKSVKAAHVAAPSLTDETYPFHWSGPKAFDTWIAQLTKNEAAAGNTDGVVWFGEPTREAVADGHAYVITPSIYTFKQKGRTMRETGTITFVLIKQKAGWKIASWTWTSPEAQPIK